MQDGGSPSFLRLLEGSPELPNFCFHGALLGPTHKCASSYRAGSTRLEEMGVAVQDPLDCCGATDAPDTTADLKCFVLSSTPLRKMYSPHNLVLDSDTDSGWSMCMATPTCQQSVKRTPLTITSDEDSPMCTALDSSTEGEGVGPSGSTEDRSHNGEKIRNAVFWKPREKSVARALFSKPSPPSRADSDGSSHLPLTPTLPRHSTTPAQRLQGRFDQCIFSPVTPSPLVHQSHTPLVPANDSPLLSSSVVAETPPGKRQGCEDGWPGGWDKHEESSVSCSQDLFASPETPGISAGEPKATPTSAQHQELAFEQECHTSGAVEINSPLQDQLECLQPNPTAVAADVRVVECTPLREPAGTADSSLHHNQSDVFDLLFMSASQLESHFHPSDRHDHTPTGGGKPTDSSPMDTALNTVGADGPQYPKDTYNVCSQAEGSKLSPTGCTSPPPSAGSSCNSIAKMTDDKQFGDIPVPELVLAIGQTAATCSPLQEPQKLPDRSLALKRRKLTNKTFLYPGSKQLIRGRKRAVCVKTKPSAGGTIEQCAGHSNPETDSVGSCQAVVSGAAPSFRPTLRHKKRNVMMCDAPPAKKPCLQTEGSGEGPEVGQGERTAGIETPLQPLDSGRSLDQNKPSTDPPTLDLAAEQQCVTTPPPPLPMIASATAADACLDERSTVDTTCNFQSTSDLDQHGSDEISSHNIAAGDQHNPPAEPPTHNPPAEPPTLNPPAELPTHNPPAEPPTHNPPAELPTHNLPAELPTHNLPAESPTHNPPAEPHAHNPPAEPHAHNPPAEPPTHNPPAELPTHNLPAESPTHNPPAEPPTHNPPAELPTHNPPAEPPTHNPPAEPPTPGVVSQCQDGMALRTGQPGKAKAPGLRRGDTRAWYRNGTGDEHSLLGIRSHPPVAAGTRQPCAHCSITSEIVDSSKPPLSPAQPAPDLNTQAQGITEAGSHDECNTVVHGEPPLTCTVTEADTSFVGFQTASGKSVKISADALKRARQLLEEAEASPHLEGCRTTIMSVPVTFSVGTVSKTPSSRPTESQSHSVSLTSCSTQFKTPLIKAPSSVVANIPASAIKAGTLTPSTSTTHALTVPRRALSMKRKPAKRFKAPRPASGVSKAEEQRAIAKILGSFRSAGADCQQVRTAVDRSERRVVESGFSTAGGRKLAVSAQALQQAQLMIADDKENGIAGEVAPPTGGHHRPHPQPADCTHTPKPSGTGKLHRGKDVSLSVPALGQAQSFPPHVNVDTSQDRHQVSKTPSDASIPSVDGVCVGFQTASGKSLSVSSNSLAQARSIIASVPIEGAECELPSEPGTADRALPTGFQTAGGKGISVSHESLQSAQRLVEGEMVEAPELHPQLHPHVHPESMEGLRPQVPILTGFQTAGGRPLSVAAQSLQSAKCLLQEKQGQQERVDRTDDVTPSSMQTGSAETGTENWVQEGWNGASNTCETVNAKEGDIPTIPPVNESQCSEENVDFDDVDMDTVASFTQIDFHSRAQDQLPVHPQPTSRGPESSPGQEPEGFPPNEADTGCYLSTQVVRQLLEFSSGEESEEEGGSAVLPREPLEEVSSCLYHHGNQNPKANSSVEGSVSSTPPSNPPLSTRGLQLRDIEQNQVTQPLPTTLSPAIQEMCSLACEHCATQTCNHPSHVAPGRERPAPPYQGLSRCPSASEETETVMSGEVLGERVLGALDVSVAGEKHASNTTVTGDARQTTVTLPHVATDAGRRMEAESSLQTGHLSQDQEQPPAIVTEDPGSGEVTPSTCLSQDVEPLAQAPSTLWVDVADKRTQDGVFPGLQTASGKEVHISQLALAAVRQSQLASVPGLQTASGRVVEISQASLDLIRRTSADTSDAGGGRVRQQSKCGFPGLQTASGKSVTVTQKSLNQVRRTLDVRTDPEAAVSQQCKIIFPGLQTAGGRRVEVSESSLQAARRALQEGTDTARSGPGLPGLQTAGGRRVEVSESSLQAARRALQEGTDTARSGPGLPGLQTAGGRRVEVSESSLQAARRALQEGADTARSGPGLPGLQTAGGRRVEVSESSLQAARRALQEGTDTARSGPGLPGLQTAGGRRVEVSESSLQAARRALQEGTDTARSGPGLPGLQTAGGRRVEVSESSLQAARRALQEGTDTARSGPGLPGLQTAGGRRVEVSESSLQAARRALQEGTDTARSGPGLPGLQTAGGRRVEVFESSLQATRRALHLEGTAHPRPDLGVSDGSCREERGPGVSLPTAGSRSHDGGLEADGLAVNKSSHNSSRIGNTAPSTEPALQQVPTLSPATPTAAGSAATPRVYTVAPRYKPSFSAACSQPSAIATSAPPSSDEAIASLPAQRYKPVFKLGSTKRRGVATTPSLTSTPTPGIQQPASARGITTTPEGVMLDRAPPPGRRPLIPVQTFLQDGAYLTATPTSRHPHNVERTPFATPQFPTSSSFQSSRTSASKPFHSTAIFGSHSTYTPSATQSRTTELSCRGTPTVVTGSTGQSGLSRSNTTPRRRTHSKPGHAPVWKASVGRRPQSWGVEEQQHLRETTMAECTSSVSSSKSTPISAPGEGMSLPMGGGSTSTQLEGSEPIPLSPINITLSQVCALEDSQARQSELVQPSGRSELMASMVDDSGYQSKNQSEVGASRSSGFGNTRVCSSFPIPEHALESGLASPSFSAFAETAKESLDDSLEERNCDPKHETQENVTNSASRVKVTPPPKPHDVRTRPLRPKERSRHFGRTTERSGPVRPQLGSLLAARMQCSSSQRMSLKEAVGGRVPGSYSREELHSLGVHPSVVGVSVANAESFTFSGPHYFSPAVLQGAAVCVGDGVMLQLREGCAGVVEFWQAFVASPGVELRLISREWFSNHWKWLVWKLAAMEVAYPQEFAGRCLTPDWLALQLKGRYDREIDRAERPALRKICEHDDVPSRTMVLCVSHIDSERLSTEDSVVDHSAAASGEGINESRDASESGLVQSEGLPCVELSDGWYSLPAILDRPLRYMLKAGKITVGSKLITYGAELVGSTGPCHPLEAPASLALKLSANSTRRARWFAPLGYQRLPHPFRLPLASIFADGGLVGCVDVVVSRVYPLLFLEKAKEGRNVLRSARAEERVATLHQAERQRKMEAICSRVEAELQEEGERQERRRTTCRRSRRLNTLQIKQLQDGEEIHNALTTAPDPVAFQEVLSRTQQVLLESYRQSLRDQQQAQLQSRVRQAMEEAEDSLPPPRKVVPLLRVRLVPVGAHPSSLDCQLSVWGRASEGVQEVLREGKSLRLFNVTASPNRRGLPGRQRLQLSATKATRYEPLSLPSCQLASYVPRQCVDIGDLPSVSPTHGEVDVVGVVVSLTFSSVPSGESAVRQLDTAYLASSRRQLLAVRVWNGFKAHALDDIITPGALLGVSNLSYRGYTHQLPMATASDSCSFSQNPKEAHLRHALQELRSNLPQCKGDFLRELEEVITSSYL